MYYNKQVKSQFNRNEWNSPSSQFFLELASCEQLLIFIQSLIICWLKYYPIELCK